MKTNVIHASKYSFDDKETGRKIEGMKITCLESQEDDINSKGRPVVKFSAPLTLWHIFKQNPIPGEYDLDLKIKMDTKSGKPIATCVNANPIPK